MEKKLYLVSWPNGEREIVLARDEVDLYLLLDLEADPLKVEIREIALEALPPARIPLGGRITVLGSEGEELPIVREFHFDPNVLASVYGIKTPTRRPAQSPILREAGRA